jgi:hypothetical protein
MLCGQWLVEKQYILILKSLIEPIDPTWRYMHTFFWIIAFFPLSHVILRYLIVVITSSTGLSTMLFLNHHNMNLDIWIFFLLQNEFLFTLLYGDLVGVITVIFFKILMKFRLMIIISISGINIWHSHSREKRRQRS